MESGIPSNTGKRLRAMSANTHGTEEGDPISTPQSPAFDETFESDDLNSDSTVESKRSVPAQDSSTHSTDETVTDTKEGSRPSLPNVHEAESKSKSRSRRPASRNRQHEVVRAAFLC